MKKVLSFVLILTLGVFALISTANITYAYSGDYTNKFDIELYYDNYSVMNWDGQGQESLDFIFQYAEYIVGFDDTYTTHLDTNDVSLSKDNVFFDQSSNKVNIYYQDSNELQAAIFIYPDGSLASEGEGDLSFKVNQSFSITLYLDIPPMTTYDMTLEIELEDDNSDGYFTSEDVAYAFLSDEDAIYFYNHFFSISAVSGTLPYSTGPVDATWLSKSSDGSTRTIQFGPDLNLDPSEQEYFELRFDGDTYNNRYISAINFNNLFGDGYLIYQQFMYFTITFNVPVYEVEPNDIIATDSIYNVVKSSVEYSQDSSYRAVKLKIYPLNGNNFAGASRFEFYNFFSLALVGSSSLLHNDISIYNASNSAVETINLSTQDLTDPKDVFVDFVTTMNDTDYIVINFLLKSTQAAETVNFTTLRAMSDIYALVDEPDNASPVVSSDSVYITNVDNPTPLATIQSYITVVDETDGDITDQLVITSDDYTPNMGVVGSYDVSYSVSDAAGNTTTFTITINQYDVVSPSYNTSTQTSINVGTNETFTPTSYIATLGFSDNYDPYEDLTISIDDQYTAYKTTVGVYTITYTATDTSGNEVIFELDVNVVDILEPVISGVTNITKGNNVSLKATDVLLQLTATDNVDGDVTSDIYIYQDNYRDTNKTGSYIVTYAVSDQAGNLELYQVTFIVSDVISPTAYIIDGQFFTVSEVDSMTTQDIIDILISTGQLDAGTPVSVLNDDYSLNAANIGQYVITLSVDGQQQDYTINVVSDGTIATLDTSTNFVMPAILIGSIILVVLGIIINKKSAYKKY